MSKTILHNLAKFGKKKKKLTSLKYLINRFLVILPIPEPQSEPVQKCTKNLFANSKAKAIKSTT